MKGLNQPRALRFNYITTGPGAQEEKAVSSKDNRKGLEIWESVKDSKDDAEEIRKFLVDKAANLPAGKTCLLPPGLLTVLNEGTAEQLQEQLIRPFSWFPDEASFDALVQNVEKTIYDYSVRNPYNISDQP